MYRPVRAKKHLGQHFLNDLSIAQDIVNALTGKGYEHVLEIGPGMGVLTQFLIKRQEFELTVCEVDEESVAYLKQNFPALGGRILSTDILTHDLNSSYAKPVAIIGNFPYNISSQILFKVYDNKNLVPEVVGMFQKEVAERIAAGPGSKTYGILSVLLQAYYDIEYLFTVDEHVFTPPPKVKSGVIRLIRNSTNKLNCDEKLFKATVKQGFNQRRKTLRNSLKQLSRGEEFPYSDQRAEQLSVEQFVEITQVFELNS